MQVDSNNPQNSNQRRAVVAQLKKDIKKLKQLIATKKDELISQEKFLSEYLINHEDDEKTFTSNISPHIKTSTLSIRVSCQAFHSINGDSNTSKNKSINSKKNTITGLDWNDDSTAIVSSSRDSKLVLTDSITGNKKIEFPINSEFTLCVAHSKHKSTINTSKMIAYGIFHCNENICRIISYNNETGKLASTNDIIELKHFEKGVSKGGVPAIEFMPNDNNQIITVGFDSNAILWDIEKQCNIKIFSKHSKEIWTVDINKNDCNIVATTGSDNFMYIWDIRVGNDEYIQRWKGKIGDVNTLSKDKSIDMNAIKWLPDGESIIVSCNQECYLYDLKACRILENYYRTERINKGNVTSLDVSKSGNFMFVGYDGNDTNYNNGCNGLSWNVVTGQIVESQFNIVHKSSNITRVKTSPNGCALASGHKCNAIRIWSV